MSEKKIVVPEGRRKAVRFRLANSGLGLIDIRTADAVMQAFAEELSENPIVPTHEQVEEMRAELVPFHPHWANIVSVWQRRMFLVPPEPEVPEEVKDLLITEKDESVGYFLPSEVNRRIIEAHRLGRESKK